MSLFSPEVDKVVDHCYHNPEGLTRSNSDLMVDGGVFVAMH